MHMCTVYGTADQDGRRGRPTEIGSGHTAVVVVSQSVTKASLFHAAPVKSATNSFSLVLDHSLCHSLTHSLTHSLARHKKIRRRRRARIAPLFPIKKERTTQLSLLQTDGRMADEERKDERVI